MKRYGFTLIELLVVIVILSILITLGSKGLSRARVNAKKAQAMIEMKSIGTAVGAYMNKYGKLPVSDALQGASDLPADEESSKDTIKILTGLDVNENPAEMVFLDPQGNETDGTFKDPWGEQYLIVLDTDYDGEIRIENKVVRRKVALVSRGLYLLGNSSKTNDLIVSWQ